jgi:hypothetical protein
MMALMRVPAVVISLLGFVLAASAAAGPLPPPPTPPKFWTVNRCEQAFRTRDRLIQTAEGNGFHVGLAICVGTGGPRACRWARDHRSRLYSEFAVFARSHYIGSIVRSFTLETRGGPGLVRVVHHAGDQYVGWPADFYTSPRSVKLLASSSTPATFRSLVATVAANLTRLEDATECSSA